MSWWGAHIAYAEETEGHIGVANASIYGGWGHFGFHWITPFHNIAGMLSESASADFAWPIYVQPDQLEGSPNHMLPAYEAQTTFPHPWPGGWWTVRDIVQQQKVASFATLDMAAKNRRLVLRNMVLKAQRQVARGAAAEPVHNGPTGPLAAFIVPAEQHDALTAVTMIDKLLQQGVEVRRATEAFNHEGRVYGAGSWVVSMAQPKRGLIRWLLGRTFYPDNAWTRDRDGNPIRPYDLAAHVMAEFMGVDVVPAATPVTVPTTVVQPHFDVQVIERLPYVTSGIEPAGSVAKGAHGYRLDGRLNAAFRAVNMLWDDGVSGIRRVTSAAAGSGMHAGDFLIPANAPEAALRRAASATGVDFVALDAEPATTPVRRLRIGMYHRFYGGNIDEGWTRLVLERFAFPYDRLMDDRIRKDDLRKDYDVIILPADNPAIMKGPGSGGQLGGYYQRYLESTPPKYRSGFGAEGVKALEAFVNNGGTLVTFGEAGALPIQEFDLPVRNVVDGLSATEFWCPGSTLEVNVDNTDPLAFGMPSHAYALFLDGSQAYETSRTDHAERIHRIITFPKAGADQASILRSGWLLGADALSEKAAMLAVQHGDGQVVLIGFRPQHRGQTWGTFKVVFDALVAAPAGGRR